MASLKDVARRAGVSLGTASNVLNRPDAVSPALRVRVEDAIAELGFVRNEAARHLRAGSSRTIAVVVLDVANPFFTDVVAGVEEAAEERGALVVVANSGGSADRERRHLARLEEQRVLGVLLTPVQDELGPVAGGLVRRGTPLVLLDRVGEGLAVPSVSVDDVRGGELAGEHLLARGHRRVAFVGGPTTLGQVRDRLSGLRRALGAVAEVTEVPTPDLSVRAGSQAAARLFAEAGGAPPSAVFCANDLLALGVLNECLRRGVRVPDDLAIVGYDDIAFAATAPVPLTSVRQPRDQLGRRGVELLLGGEPAAGDGQPDGSGPPAGSPGSTGAPPEQVRFTPELVLRSSTAVRPGLTGRSRGGASGAARPAAGSSLVGGGTV